MDWLIRTDAGTKKGMGHAMRMLALAQAAQDVGVKAGFLMRECPDAFRIRLEREQMQLVQLLDDTVGSSSDAMETLAHVKSANTAWAILDGYDFGYDYQRVLYEHGCRVAVMDDYQHLQRWCAELVIHPSLEALSQDEFPNELQAFHLLSGPEYALLRREFWTQRSSLTASCVSTHEPQRRILVIFGGADSANLTGQWLQLLHEIGSELELKVRAVLGPANPHHERLISLCERLDIEVEILVNVEEMHAQYTWADGCITAVGGSTWEWIRMGVPALFMSVAENQKKMEDTLIRMRIGTPGGRLECGRLIVNEKEVWRWLQYLNRVLPAPDPLVVDGQGALRVVNYMMRN